MGYFLTVAGLLPNHNRHLVEVEISVSNKNTVSHCHVLVAVIHYVTHMTQPRTVPVV